MKDKREGSRNKNIKYKKYIQNRYRKGKGVGGEGGEEEYQEEVMTSAPETVTVSLL